MRTSRACGGFTVIELMVVIAIIAILAALLIPAVGMLNTNAKRAKTTHNLSQLTFAVSTYLDTYGRLGSLMDPAGDSDPQHSMAFRCDPWYFLYVTPMLTKAEPFFAPTGLKLVTATGANTCVPAVNAMHATHICDAWGTNPDNVLSWGIVNGSPVGGSDRFSFTQSIDLRSSAGTATKITDDIVFHYSSQTQRWDLVKTTDPWNNGAFFNEPLPAGSMEHP
jgi:prepilin-type N-terminal cleavage/methylation domain-containing protein